MDAFIYEYLLIQSVFYQVLNKASDGVFKRKLFHFKRIGTEKHMWTSDFYRYGHIYS